MADTLNWIEDLTAIDFERRNHALFTSWTLPWRLWEGTRASGAGAPQASMASQTETVLSP